MKKVILIALLVVGTAEARSQPTNDISERISSKMTDTLNLNNSQRKRILDINTQIQNSKMDVRRKFENLDSIAKYTQRIENKRDSLYQEVLTDEKYKLYLQKKRSLVSAQ